MLGTQNLRDRVATVLSLPQLLQSPPVRAATEPSPSEAPRIATVSLCPGVPDRAASRSSLSPAGAQDTLPGLPPRALGRAPASLVAALTHLRFVAFAREA